MADIPIMGTGFMPTQGTTQTQQVDTTGLPPRLAEEVQSGQMTMEEAESKMAMFRARGGFRGRRGLHRRGMFGMNPAMAQQGFAQQFIPQPNFQQFGFPTQNPFQQFTGNPGQPMTFTG